MATDRSDLVLSVLVAIEGAHAFSAFMPSYFTIQKFSQDSSDLALLRSGYLPAVAFNVALGLAVSYLINSPEPLIFIALVSVFMISLYERALAKTGVA